MYCNKRSAGRVLFDCDFEYSVVNMRGMLQDTLDDIDWTRKSGATGSSATGPPHGYGGVGYYIYIEASSRDIGDIAR